MSTLSQLHRSIPLLDKQESALRNLKRMLSPEPTAEEIEDYRKIRLAVIKNFDNQRDQSFPGWRVHNH